MPQFESTGFNFDDTEVIVSDLTLDSLQFAGGDFLWVLRGEFRSGKLVCPFNIKSASNPVKDKIMMIPFLSEPPAGFKKENVECVITTKHNLIEITWRTPGKRIYLKSMITSGR